MYIKIDATHPHHRNNGKNHGNRKELGRKSRRPILARDWDVGYKKRCQHIILYIYSCNSITMLQLNNDGNIVFVFFFMLTFFSLSHWERAG